MIVKLQGKVDYTHYKRRAVTVCGEAEESTVLYIMDKYGDSRGHDASLHVSSPPSSSDSSPLLLDAGKVDDIYQALSNVLGISCKELHDLYKRFEESGRTKAFRLGLWSKSKSQTIISDSINL